MFSFIFWGFIFVIAFGLLIISADLFIDKAKDLGKNLGIPTFIIGLIIVSLGTTLPELSSSIYATIKGNSEIVISNVVGSAITNILLIVGLVGAFFGTLLLKKETIKKELWLLFVVVIIFVAFVSDRNFSLFEAIMCLIIFIIYFIYNYLVNKSKMVVEKSKESTVRCIFWIIIYSVIIYIGAKYVVDSVINLAVILGIGAEVIAVTVIALGTSLPELTVSLVSAKKGDIDIAIANIIGANTLNLLVVFSVSRFFGKLYISKTIFYIAIPFLILSTIFFVFIIYDKKLTKVEGFSLLGMYFLFIALLFIF